MLEVPTALEKLLLLDIKKRTEQIPTKHKIYLSIWNNYINLVKSLYEK